MRTTWIVLAAVCSTLLVAGCSSDEVEVAAPGSSCPQSPIPPAPASTSKDRSGPGYAKDKDGNSLAAEAASKYHDKLQEDPTFGGLAIESAGLRVDVVGPPSANVNTAVAGMRKVVPVRTRPVNNSLKDLTALTAQIDRDAGQWRDKGVNLSSWGPERDSNTVRVTLTEYRPEAAQQLLDAYCTDRLSVSRRSETVHLAADQ